MTRDTPSAQLSAGAQRLVTALRRAIRATHRLAPEDSFDDEAVSAEQLANALEAAGTLDIVQPMAEHQTRHPLVGQMNPIAPPVVFDSVDGVVIGRARFHEGYQGPPQCVHGGWIASLFDDALGRTQRDLGRYGVTGSLSVTYKRPTPINTDLEVRAHIEELRERRFRAVGELWCRGEITATAEAWFIFIADEKFTALTGDGDSGSSGN